MIQFFCVIKNINKNPDTVFHTPRIILDSIHFGDCCCKTGVGKLLAVSINTMILDHSRTHSFLCYRIRSRVIFGRCRHDGRVELLQQRRCDLQSLSCLLSGPFQENVATFALESGWSWRSPMA